MLQAQKISSSDSLTVTLLMLENKGECLDRNMLVTITARLLRLTLPLTGPLRNRNYVKGLYPCLFGTALKRCFNLRVLALVVLAKTHGAGVSISG